MSKRSSKDLSLEVSKYQKFEAVIINRANILNAPYNPRTIDKHARKKLKDNIKKTGLIETLVWNKRTGNLVSGHQRLSILDELEGSKDYNLTVAVIDVDDKKEKELNVFLNNTNVMGNYDLTQLENLLKDGISLENTGFDKIDLALMFDNADSTIFTDDKDAAKTDIEMINKLKENKQKYKDKIKKEDDAEFYIVAVFQSRNEVDVFLKTLNFDLNSRYINGLKLAALLGVELHKDSTSPLPERV